MPSLIEQVLANVDRRMAEYVHVSGPPELPPFTGNEERVMTGNTAAPKDYRLAEIAAPRVTPKPAPSTGRPKTGAAGRPKAASASAKSARAEATTGAAADALAEQLAAASVSEPAAPTAALATAPAAASGTAATAQPTEQPQFADDDPDSPYWIIDEATTESVLYNLEQILLRDLVAQQWDTYYVRVPPAPKTAKAAAKLREQVDQLLAEGRTFEATPWQCQIAIYCVQQLGPEHADTLRAVYDVALAASRRNQQGLGLCAWLLPRAAKALGLGHPDTRQLAEWGALFVGNSQDPRTFPKLTRAVTNICRHLVGGLGWGTAAVTPLPNEREFERWFLVMVTARANMEHHPKAAKELIEHSIKYFTSLGPHWRGSQKAAKAREMLAECVGVLEGPAATERVRMEAKRAAQKELGPAHGLALDAMWRYADGLFESGRIEAAMSLFHKTLQLRQETLGRTHADSYDSQLDIARVLIKANKIKEAEDMLQDMIDNGVKSLGPQEHACREAMRVCYELLSQQGPDRRRDAVTLKVKAARLGFDVSAPPGEDPIWVTETPRSFHVQPGELL